MSDDGDLNVQREIEIDKQLAKWHNAAFEGIAALDIGEAMAPGLALWVTDGVPPGDFLAAVLQNNLMDAIRYADSHNEDRLLNWGRVLYDYVPSACYGSPLKYSNWIDKGGLKGVLLAGEIVVDLSEGRD